MGEKRLDFDAPLLSVRRIASRNELIPKPVVNPGLVPFTWEQTPGRPKRLSQDPVLVEDDDGEASEDGVETFSCKDSSLFDCSVSGSFDDVEDSKSSDKDADACEFMMGRFLEAAKAMATGPFEISSSKEPQKDGNINYRRLPVPLPYQNTTDFVSKIAYDREELERHMEEDGDEGEDYVGGTQFSRACGFIPRLCLKSSFLLLNPIPGMKVQSHSTLNSPIKVSNHMSLAQAADESWDVIYKHKISHMNSPLEDESKLTSESNKLTCWSDSQTPDDSSSHHSPKSPFNEEKSSLGVLRRELKGRKTISFDWCERISEKYGNMSPAKMKKQGSASMSPSIDRILCAVDTMETPNLRSISIDAIDNNPGDVEDNSVREIRQENELQAKILEQSNFDGRNCSDNSQLTSKMEDKEKNSDELALSLPPPLLKSPSESWLQQTLPSVSSKNQFTQSLSSIQGQHKKQASWASSKDFRQANDVIALKRTQRTRFA